ncbi:MAG: Outer membrane protein P6 precursor [Bacteroidetes bacterium ADurb.Bin397]|nr:MAG: Outer membrane protein P6 precursor [Bacteroidetes bacterium ADurb.Bin397]
MVVARALKANPELKIMITGNTDVTASEQYNDKLGLKRADAVKNHLVKVYGIDAARLSTESKGEKDPLANTANKPMNRRVDFSVVK